MTKNNRYILSTFIMQQAFVLLAVLKLAACKEEGSFIETRIRTAGKFIECLKNNEPDDILDYTYQDVDHKIYDKESREMTVENASKLINKFGLPPKEKWVIKYDPKNNIDRLIIKIPLFKGHDTTFKLFKADIVLRFPPPQISSKIYEYDIDAEYELPDAIPPHIEPSKGK